MPPRLGTKIMPAGAQRPTFIASWPAPLAIRTGSMPSSRAAAVIASMTSGAIGVGGTA
jgi:acid phosphatase family membrane protein YuiD